MNQNLVRNFSHEWQEPIEPEGGVVMHLLVVEDEAGLVVEHADEAVGGRLAGLGPQHDRREGLRHAPRLHEDVKVRIRVSEEALRQGLLDIVDLRIDDEF